MAAKADLKEGDLAPDFELADETGERFRLSAFRGNTVVLYFYPADDTPGCTREACGFRDRYVHFLKANAVVLGVSPDPAESHAAFKEKFSLPFPLLVDEDHAVAERYGAWGEKTWKGETFEGILRSTFVVGPTGRIEKIFRNVDPEGHERDVLAAVSG